MILKKAVTLKSIYLYFRYSLEDSSLQIMFNAFQNIQSNRYFYATEGISEVWIFYMCRLHGRGVMETCHQNDFRHL